MAKRRIAITGLSKAGKSVFLVSLLQHLKYSTQGKFSLNDEEIKGCKTLPVEDGFFKPFPYEDLLVDLTAEKGGVIMRSTRDACKFRFRLTTKRDRPVKERAWAKIGKLLSSDEKDYIFEFIDFPGERLADIEIFANESFAGWSDALEKTFRSHRHIYENLAEYRAFIDNMGGDPSVDAKECADKLTAAYKKALTALMMNKVQLITPSSFVKELESGLEFTKDDFDNHGENRPCGISGHDFVPVPESFRTRRQDVTGIFAANFETYRKKAVTPLFSALKKCDCLLYLVDIPDILSNSFEKYDETARLLEVFGESLARTGWLEGVAKFSRSLASRDRGKISESFDNIGGGSIKKVLFVATKSDMVSELDQGNLKSLTESLMTTLGRSMQVHSEAHVVSAWVSTSNYPEEPYKLNSMVRAQSPESGNLKDLVDMEHTISKIPAEWPQRWKRGEYRFPEQALYPLLMQTNPPQHRNLDAVFRSLLKA